MQRLCVLGLAGAVVAQRAVTQHAPPLQKPILVRLLARAAPEVRDVAVTEVLVRAVATTQRALVVAAVIVFIVVQRKQVRPPAVVMAMVVGTGMTAAVLFSMVVFVMPAGSGGR